MINEMTVALVTSVKFARMSRLNSHEMSEIETSFTIKPLILIDRIFRIYKIKIL
jgi:hypothetical protein